MTPVLLVLGTIALFALGLVLARWWLARLSWTGGIDFEDEPTPPEWSETVRRNFTASRYLSEPDFERLLRLSQVFIRDKHFEGAAGFEVTEEVRVTIAAQACYLLLGTELAVFPRTRSIVVYPSSFVPRHVDGLGGHEAGPASLGQAWSTGTVVLAWDSAKRGAWDPSDGKNVTFHEFAHQLDQNSGEMSGTPGGVAPSSLKRWAQEVEKGYRRLRRSARQNRRDALDHYGATNRVEFFAVATEAFFEKPRPLAKAYPELYAELAAFYGRDPAGAVQAPEGAQEQRRAPHQSR